MEWTAADIATLSNSTQYIIIGEGAMADTKTPCIIFRRLDGKEPIQVLDKVRFEKLFVKS